MKKKKREYDVALSFAGEDRPFAEYLAKRLKALGLRVFYDEFERATLWGRNLYESLHHIYSEKADHCVLIISKHYVKKEWTKKEWHSVQERALREPEEYILPVRLDDSKLPGLPGTIGYLDATQVEQDEIVALLVQKIASRLKASSQRSLPDAAISGSHRDDRFHEVCRQLGSKLIKGGFRIISGGTEHVGYQVSVGAYEYLQSIGANFYDKRDLIITYTNENYPGFPAVKFGTPIPVTQPEVEVYRSEFIDRVNLILSISGREGTWKEYQLAKALGKPVVPLAATGGSARRIWEDIRGDIQGFYAGQVGDSQFAALQDCGSGNWQEYLDVAVSLLRAVSSPQKPK